MKTFTRSTLVVGMGLLSLSPLASATVPISALTTYTQTVYGLYTTTDATCQTGWQAILKFSTTGQTGNMAASGGLNLGTAVNSISNPTNCILMIVKNGGTYTLASGSYTSSSSGGSDSVCNSGVSSASLKYFGSNSAATISWPASTQAPTQDMVAAGVSQITSITSGAATGNEYVPIYASVNSACYNNSTLDASTSGCNANSISMNMPPTSSGDTAHGVKTTAPTQGMSKYKFVINFSSSFGNQGSSTCGMVAPPYFQFIGTSN